VEPTGTFIPGSLARYDSNTAQILQNQLVIAEQLKTVQDLAGAAVHLHVKAQVLGLRQEPDETPKRPELAFSLATWT
jgi:hypothetical protein